MAMQHSQIQETQSPLQRISSCKCDKALERSVCYSTLDLLRKILKASVLALVPSSCAMQRSSASTSIASHGMSCWKDPLVAMQTEVLLQREAWKTQ